MIKRNAQLTIGLSEYAVTAYTALVANHPVNGSQLSRNSGIPRARIYDVLRTLKSKGFVVESSEGMYTPIPPDELIRRLRQDHETLLTDLEERLKKAQQQTENDVIWHVKGYTAIMEKAKEMILKAHTEIYARMDPEEGGHLDPLLEKAKKRRVTIKYISMKPVSLKFEWQVIHPPPDPQKTPCEDRFFDLVVDRKEVLCGMFTPDSDQEAVIHWGTNEWFVTSVRDSLRHDFFHYFLHKTMNGPPLTSEDKALYERVSKDF